MSETTNQDKIFEGIRAVLADCLAVSESKISPESSLIEDLGADSLDFLDILFRVEKVFSIMLRDSEINRLLRGENPAAPVQSQSLTAEEISRLEQWLPALRLSPKKDRIQRREVFSYITVESLVLLVEKRLVATATIPPRLHSSPAGGGM